MVMGVKPGMGALLPNQPATGWADEPYVGERPRLLSADDPPDACRGCSARCGRF